MIADTKLTVVERRRSGIDIFTLEFDRAKVIEHPWFDAEGGLLGNDHILAEGAGWPRVARGEAIDAEFIANEHLIGIEELTVQFSGSRRWYQSAPWAAGAHHRSQL